MVAAPSRSSLKATCPVRDFYTAVQTVGHAVSGRTSLPILNHILIEMEDNALRLLAYDGELSISCRLNAQIVEEGALTAPAKTLTEVVGHLPDKQDVDISVDKSHTVRLHCDRSDYKILGLPAEEYLRPPEVRDATSFSISQGKLREMIRQTLFAVSTDESRRILTGVLMVFDGDAVKFVATDTHRLAVKTASVRDGQGAQTVIVPARAMNELTRLLTESEGDVRVTLSANQARFALPGEAGVQIACSLIEGQFPNYQRVVPTEHQKRLTVPTFPLLQAVRRASIVARENANRVILRTEDDKLILTAESAMVGNAYEELEVVREGEDVEIAFNAKYLLDVLSVLEEDGLHMELSEPLKPGVIRPIPGAADDGEKVTEVQPDYLCVLMPMQIV